MNSPETARGDAGVRGTGRRSGTVAALGEPALLAGFRLAGAVLYPAAGAAQVRAAWTNLPDTVAAVVLTPAAARILAGDLDDPGSPLTAVLPVVLPAVLTTAAPAPARQP